MIDLSGFILFLNLSNMLSLLLIKLEEPFSEFNEKLFEKLWMFLPFLSFSW